jgi:predicted enzyme related to lactoylglutathione lyase
MENHILNWFEIPVAEFSRARQFYETILAIEMQVEELDNVQMAYFPFFNGKPTGCITSDTKLSPSQNGVLIYLNGDPDLTLILNRVVEAGGQVLEPKTPVSPNYGFFALFLDTEGNKVGLQSEF